MVGRVVYNLVGFLEIAAGVGLGLALRTHYATPVAIAGAAFVVAAVDLAMRLVRLRSANGTGDALLANEYGGMLYYAPVWVIALAAGATGVAVQFANSGHRERHEIRCKELSGDARQKCEERERRCYSTHAPTDCDPLYSEE